MLLFCISVLSCTCALCVHSNTTYNSQAEIYLDILVVVQAVNKVHIKLTNDGRKSERGGREGQQRTVRLYVNVLHRYI